MTETITTLTRGHLFNEFFKNNKNEITVSLKSGTGAKVIMLPNLNDEGRVQFIITDTNDKILYNGNLNQIAEYLGLQAA